MPMMKVQEPLHAHLELRFRLFGVPVRIGLLFWIVSALLGAPFYADPELGTVTWFAMWMVLVLGSVLVQELGHALVGRLFGMHGEVVLSGLGGMTMGVDDLPRRWQRIVVLLARPLVGIVVLAVLWGLLLLPPPAFLGPEMAVGMALAAKWLLQINLFWTALNLVPLWPLGGGRIACEIGEGLFGKRGVIAALVLCLATIALLTFLWTAFLSAQLHVPFAVPYQVGEWIRYTQTSRLWLLEYSFLIFLCYLLWIRTFRALWPEKPDLEGPACR
jgi:stage IV sporulation protein FB